MGYILTIDKGTTVVKCVLFDEQGQEYAVVRREETTQHPKPGWHEEDPEHAWGIIAELIREIIFASGVPAGEILAVGVTTHMGGVILLDEAMQPVYNNVLWDDSRAAGIVEEWATSGVLNKLVAEGGQAILAGLTVPLLQWFKRNEPEVLNRAARLCNTKDYIVMRLTGSLGTDESDAGWMPSDVRQRAYSETVWALAGVERYAGLFPPIRKSHEVVGGVLPEVARQLGLREGTPVIAGIGDANASTIGVGVVRPGQGVSIVGTSLLNNIITRQALLEPIGLGFVIPTVNNFWMRMLPNTGGGSINLRWLVELAYRDLPNPYEVLDTEAGGVHPGALGVFYHPYISNAGVVAPFYHLGARAQFTGLHAGVGRAELARAVIEGLAFSIRDCFEACPEALSEVRLSGGAARSAVLCQTVADVLKKPVLLTTGEEAAARGVAIVAAAGTGLFNSVDEATEQFVQVRHVYEPNASSSGAYAERFELFQQIRKTMMPVWTAREKFERAS
ncbi:MAG TPA: FGGY-family carbohydrate kinase [Anaerolineales bacterium]|nr:FGGY-family carbohydrate kinase [Anaerolineales bacterium]